MMQEINNEAYFSYELKISSEAKLLHDEIKKCHKNLFKINYKELLKVTMTLLKRLDKKEFLSLYQKYSCNPNLKKAKDCMKELASEIINSLSDLDLRYLVF